MTPIESNKSAICQSVDVDCHKWGCEVGEEKAALLNKSGDFADYFSLRTTLTLVIISFVLHFLCLCNDGGAANERGSRVVFEY